ncbi:LPXTG cell wall anchor domain-containing protein [Arthrobacter sp. NPDC090010]|uniref:DUF7507 domain-containing protein n=1 Tax=Arthrobacter sp. NPDC090010 TaxID=3363942 RepID=UPI0037F71B08
MLVALLTVAPVQRAYAAGLMCTDVYGIQGGAPRNLWRVDTSTGAQTSVGTFTTTGSAGNINGLGISADGSKAYAIQPEANNARVLYEFDTSTGTTTRLGAGVTNAPLTHGAMSPNGIYYYGGFSGAQNEMLVYGYNPQSRQSLGLVARGNIPTAGANGDWAFDSQGDLYVVGGVNGQNVVSVVTADLPTTAGNTITITGKELSRPVTPANQPLNGMAFGGDGYLYVSSAARMYKIHPTTGANLGNVPITQQTMVDAASCATPNTVELQKNFPEGRVQSGDQVTLSINGEGITRGNTATTTGDQNGIQAESAGPVLVLGGDRISIAETGSGAQSPGYQSQWVCTDRNSGQEIAHGDGTEGAFTMPSDWAMGVSALCTFTNTAQKPGIALEKTVDKTELVAGETITYSFKVTNTGNVPLNDVKVNEGDFSGSGTLSEISCPDGAKLLAPGDSVTCTATYVVTQADVDRGSLENTATATGTPPGDLPPATSPPSEANVPADQKPGISLEKSASPEKGGKAGETITYSFKVTNTGNVTLKDVKVNEGEFSGTGELSEMSCPAEAASLAPKDSVTCTASYTLTQADVDAGKVTNNATATGTPPGDLPPVTSPPSEVTVPIDPAPGVSLVKSADKTDLVAGETVTYSFVVTNTGNVTLKDVKVDEGEFSGSGQISPITCPEEANSLAPGAQVTCTASYVVTQADVDAGTLDNSATATGTPPTGDPVTSPPSEVKIPEDQKPGISLEKTASPEKGGKAGETITYSFKVTNTGNVTLKDVKVNEGDFSGTGELSAITCPTASSSIAPGESVTCTASYTLTQADADAGKVANSATATGTPPGDNPPVTSPPSEVTVPIDPAPGISLVKSVDKNELVSGETLTYSFVVTNTGNVTLKDVKVDEGEFTGSGQISPITCPEEATTLAPGSQVTCTATYVVTQADVDRGSIENSATATGTPPTGDPVTSPPSEVKIPQDPKPGISLEKSASPEKGGKAGDTITYSFKVTNTGNVTLKDVKVSEGEFSGTGELSAITCPSDAAVVLPGQTVSCTATYVLTQADVDAGKVTNTATATGTPPSGDPVTSPPSEVTVPIDPAPGISLVKSVDKNELVSGETLTYSFVVTNTGNVTLKDVKVEEGEFSGSGQMSPITCPEGAQSLAPGAQVTCTATYVVTQADVDRGSITNSATVTGTPPGDAPPVTSPPSEVKIPQDPKPGISLEKTADRQNPAAGETITYRFVVTNTGNVTLKDVKVNEGEFSGSGQMSGITCPEGSASALLPGQKVTCTASYVVTQADVDRGSITNSATATGTPPGDAPPVTSPPSDVTVPITSSPALSIVKSSDQKELVTGETVTYSFVVTNTGNVTLKDVKVNEGEFTGSGQMSAISCPEGAQSLAPGAEVTCTASYVVTQADVDRGSITNSATATGTPPGDAPPVTSPPSEVKIPQDPKPGISLMKSASPEKGGKTGDTITYSFLVTNTGNVTLKDVKVNEGEFSGTGKLSEITCPDVAMSLAPGASVTCTATYVLTQADVDAGKVTNTATATGTPPGDLPPVTSPPSEVTVPIDPAPGMSLVKSADKTELVAGETLTYSFVVTNTGNVTLQDVKVNEGEFSGTGKLSEITCPEGAQSLAPGAQVTCTATYVVTQADVDAGTLENSATATGTPPGDAPPVTSPPSEVKVPQDPKPGISIVKTADKPTVREAGETITYSFLVTNTGNVTLKDVKVNEGEFSGTGKLSEIVCPKDGASSLLPGQEVSCTATYVVTEADLVAGKLSNTATATGTPPGAAPPVTAPPSTVTVTTEKPVPPAPPTPSVELPDTGAALGASAIVGASGLLLMGTVLLLASRKRKKTSE